MTARLALCVLALHAVLAGHSAYVNALTADEHGHLASGVSYWSRGSFHVYHVNPPLVKMLAAVPVIAAGADLSFTAEELNSPMWQTSARGFVARNQAHLRWYVFLARCVTISISLLGGWLVFVWSRSVFGASAGLVGVALWALCPDLIGHAGLVTLDVPAAVFALLAMYAFRAYLRDRTLPRALVAGAAFGLGCLVKFTLLLMPVVAFAVWATVTCRRGMFSTSGLRRLGHPLLGALAMMLVVNAGYGCKGSFTPLGRYEFLSASLRGAVARPLPPTVMVPPPSNRFRDTVLGSLPVPVPSDFVRGIDEQKLHSELDLPAYLDGTWQRGGWWHYYLRALGWKLPLGTLVLGGLCSVLICKRRYRASWVEEALIWAPALVIFVSLSAETGINSHVRYVFPALAFAFVGLSRCGIALAEQAWRRPSAIAIIATCAIAWNASAVARIDPRYLSYFNEAAGGPDRGWCHLIDSNIDWGQDLYALSDWLADHPEAAPLHVAYFGALDPHQVGLERYELPRPWGAPEPGWYAVSVNFVAGMPYHLVDGRGARMAIPAGTYRYFLAMQPVAKAGYSIFIYHVP